MLPIRVSLKICRLVKTSSPIKPTNQLFHQVVVNMGKYLSQKGKVRENNECRKTRVIFADLSLLRQIFPRINHKLMK